MPTLETLRENVVDAIQDTSIEDDFIDAKFNEALELCADYVLLPELESSGTFTTATDTHSVVIPTSWNYHRGLYSAYAPDTELIDVVSSLRLLKNDYPDIDNTDIMSGNICIVTTGSGSIYYYLSPETETIVTCGFYQHPTPLTEDSHIPSCLPASMQNELLENYALWKCWKIIEDGIEGPKINTAHHRTAFNTALAELDDLIHEGQSTPNPKRGSGWI